MLPLQGIRVLDLTTIIMGPFASQWLGDFGADVVKVETPEGDSTRGTGPSPEPGMAPFFLGANRNKRSIVLDLKTDSGRDALLKLADSADVFMHNVRPQKLRKLGLGAKTLMARNKRLIFAALHGFGEAGPYGGRPAYDDIIQGLSGCADLMRRQGGAPRYFPALTADKTSGLIAAMAILAALVRRGKTGRGGHVEIPMFESMAAFNLQEHLYGRHFVPPLGPSGYPRVLSPERRPYATLDGHICMMPYTDAHWQAFFAEAGMPEQAFLPEFAHISGRTRNIDALYTLASDLIARKTTYAWLEICERRNIPAAPVLALEALETDAHLQATGFFQTVHDPAMGEVRFTGVPVLFDGERPPVALPPRLGAHTREVLEEAGMTAAEIQAVLRAGD